MWGENHAARGALAGAVLAALMTLTGCGSSTPKPVGDPDPGHRLLKAIRPVLSDVPKGAHVTNKSSDEPRWDSCDGMKSTYGWNEVTADAQFTGVGSQAQVLAHVRSRMRALGWTYDASLSDGDSWSWEKLLPGSKRAARTDLDVSHDSRAPRWNLVVQAPPATHEVSGC